eukprot:SAG22_NODE_7387_length_744_cov_4.443411_1_plen_97_part_10
MVPPWCCQKYLLIDANFKKFSTSRSTSSYLKVQLYFANKAVLCERVEPKLEVLYIEVSAQGQLEATCGGPADPFSPRPRSPRGLARCPPPPPPPPPP